MDSAFNMGLITFTFNNKEYNYIDRNHNATRDNERGVELALAKEFLGQSEDVVEIGAVTPYYFPEYTHIAYDLTDSHPRAKEKDGRGVFIKGKDVLSISTVEHFGSGAISFIEDVKKNARKYLITFPMGYDLPNNKELNEYALKNARFMSRIDPTTREDYPKDNWIEKKELTEVDKKYGTYQWANTIAIFTNIL